MRSLVLLVLLLVPWPSRVFAQQKPEGENEDAVRIEITAKTDQESYRAIPCGNHGALIFYKSVEIADAQRVRWYFSFYDRDLRQAWVKSLPILNDLDFRFKSFTADTLILVFVYTGKLRSEVQPLELVRIAVKTGTFIPNLTRVPANSDPVFFTLIGRNAYLALNHKTGQAAVEILDLKSNHSKGFLVDQMVPSAFRWFGIDSATLSLKAIITKAVSKKETEHWFEEFDTTGKVIGSVQLSTINQDREFTGFRSARNRQGEDLVIGSYRLGSGSSSQKNKAPDESTGMLTSLISQGVQKNLNFINFLELKNINSLLSAKDLADLKKKALKKSKSIGEYFVDFNILQHDPVENNGTYIEVSEVFSPQYHLENFTDFDFYGRPYSNSYSVFDGYRFTAAIVMGFTPDGQYLWDNVLEIRDLVSPDLNPKVYFRCQGDEILLAFYSSGKIGSKIIRKGETTGKLEFSPVESKYPDDKLMSETKCSLMPWYDNFLLCCGFQEIKNVALENNNKRFVFQITKVKYGE